MKALKAVLPLALLVVFATSTAHAVPVAAPEIDPSLGVGALALLGGMTVILRSRRK